MPVIGLSIKHIEGIKEKDESSEQIIANSAPRILDLEETEIKSLNKKVLSFKFEFITNYSPDVGKISLTGNVLYLTEDHQKILDDWQSDKKIPDEVSVEILNNLFRRCLLKVVNLADDLQLPPPVQLPIVKVKNKGPNKSEVEAA